MANRTKSLLFDDDVVDTFGKEGMNFTIEEILAKWQRGEAPTLVTRRAVSQCMAALVALPEKEGGLSVRHMMALKDKLVNDFPMLWMGD